MKYCDEVLEETLLLILASLLLSHYFSFLVLFSQSELGFWHK